MRDGRGFELGWGRSMDTAPDSTGARRTRSGVPSEATTRAAAQPSAAAPGAGEKRKLEQLLLDLVVRGHGSLLLIPPSISLYTSIYTSLYTSIYTSICLHLPPGARPRLAARAAR